MKKILLILLSTPLILFSCKSSNIKTPVSPFDDHYERIGMDSKYSVITESTSEEIKSIKEYINTDDQDDVSYYKHQYEKRDLKYAYFGNESSTISQCQMLSQIEDNTRYSNNVSIDINNSEQQDQTANAGIIKTNSKVTKYVYDPNYKNLNDDKKYIKATVTEKNGEETQTTRDGDGTYVEGDNSVFYIKPLDKIKEFFNSIEGFDLFGANAICGTANNGEIVLKEGFSVFSNFTTTMGRSYKAEDNYFYEGLIDNSNGSYKFKYFRFYHELLILSEAIDGEGVPVIYLDKPALIEYSEDQYWIDYKQLQPYTGDVPFPNSEFK